MGPGQLSGASLGPAAEQLALLRWLADEKVDNNIIRGLLRRRPDLDLIRARDAGLGGKQDEAVLEWAAKEGRVVLTHDVTTVTAIAYVRIEAGSAMPGVLEVSPRVKVSIAIEEILIMTECLGPEEFEWQVRYLPL